jgi:hypothetical protein
MASIAQLTANIANAQKSTGAKTEKGKHRTRLNAYRHGLTGQINLLTADEHEAFDKRCTGIRESLDPVGALEIELAQSIAEDHWRLKRARALETGIFALGQSGALGALATPDRENPAQLPIDRRSPKPAPGSPRAKIFNFWLSMSSASTAPLRRTWLNSAPCAPNAKPSINRRSKRPNCWPSLPIARAKSTIQLTTSRRRYCKLGLIFRAQA